jgi:hypothetical protein
MDFLKIYTIVLSVIAVALAVFGLSRRKTKTPDDIERERRQFLDQVGRITDGSVLDVQETYVEAGPGKDPKFAAMDQPAQLPPRPTDVGEVRSAESWQLHRDFGILERAQKLD